MCYNKNATEPLSKGDKREGESKYLPLYSSLQAVFVFLMKMRSSFLVWFRFLSFKGAEKGAFLF